MTATVLIVDDSEFVRQALAKAMQGEPDVEVLCAKNGREALAVLGGPAAVDVLVLDVHMPILDGTEVLKDIARAGKGSLFVLAIGEQGQGETLERCRALGADEVMTKPLDLDRLRSVLRVAVQASVQVTR